MQTYQQPETGLGSVAETNRLLGGNIFNTQTGGQNPPTGIDQTSFNNFQQANPGKFFGSQDLAQYQASPVPQITDASKLGTSNSLVIPTANGQTPPIYNVPQPSGTITDANGNATIPQPTDNTSSQSSTKSVRDSIMERLGMLSDKLATQPDVNLKLQEQNQLAQKTEQATKDYNAYQKAKVEQQQTIERMRTENPSGVFGGAQQDMINEYTAKSNANLANLAIIANASQGLLSAAQQTIKDKLDAQFQPLKDQVDLLTKFATINNNDLTDKEQLQLQQQINQQKSDNDAVQGAAKDIHDALLKAGAPADAYSAVDKITQDYLSGKLNAQEAQSQMFAAASPYGVSSSDLNLTQDYSLTLSGLTPQQQETFNSLPQGDQSVVSQLINGDALLSDIVKSRGASGTADIKRYIQEATAIDPTFSVNTNKVRFQFLQNWNNPNGKVATTRNSINTALGHLADFKTNADSLDPGTIKKLNSVKNVLITETGDPRVLKLRTDINALATEIATIYKGGTQPSEKEIANWEDTIASDFSKSQFQGVSDEITKLLSSKITATRYQYSSTMGRELPQSLIDPEKKQALIDAGINPDSIVKEKVPPTPPTPEEQSIIDQIRKDNPGINNADIEAILGHPISFNLVGNTTASIQIPGNTLAAKNNNPGNLRFAGQPGAMPGQGGFARFSTSTEGFNALVNQVALDAKRGHTLESFIAKFAPPSENDTRNYIKKVVAKLGVSAKTKLAQLDRRMVARVIALMESGTKIS